MITRAVVAYIEDHLGADLSLGQMAAVAGLSPSHFAHQFKRATGLPPYQYVLRHRVERAERLRAGTDLPPGRCRRTSAECSSVILTDRVEYIENGCDLRMMAIPGHSV